MFEPIKPGLVGEATGAIEAAGGIVFAEVQQTQADAVRLFRMGMWPGLMVNPVLARVRGDVLPPVVLSACRWRAPQSSTIRIHQFLIGKHHRA